MKWRSILYPRDAGGSHADDLGEAMQKPYLNRYKSMCEAQGNMKILEYRLRLAPRDSLKYKLEDEKNTNKCARFMSVLCGRSGKETDSTGRLELHFIEIG